MSSLLTEVSELELSSVADEQVLWFQVAVKDVPLVDVGQASQQLEQEQLENTGEQTERTIFISSPMISIRTNTVAKTDRIEREHFLYHMRGKLHGYQYSFNNCSPICLHVSVAH